MKQWLTLAALAAAVAAVAAAPGGGATALHCDKDGVRADGPVVRYADLLGDWSRFSAALKETVRDRGLPLLLGEKVPVPVQEWDAAAAKNVWRRPAFTAADLPGHWREIAAAWLGWKGGALHRKTCHKGACTLVVVFESGETKSNPYTLVVSVVGGDVAVDSIECAGPVRSVLKLIDKGESQWRPYARALSLPEDSAPSSEYAVPDLCYVSADRQPTVRVKLGDVSGRIETIQVTQGPWPGVTATFGAKKIESVVRARIGAD